MDLNRLVIADRHYYACQEDVSKAAQTPARFIVQSVISLTQQNAGNAKNVR
jgi:hypothetical protein